MKKKLLTILLSIFVMMGTFTTNVFAADYSTVNDILATADGFPSTAANGWVKSDNFNKKCYKGDYTLHIGDDEIENGASVTKIDDNTYTVANATFNSGTLTFNLENGKLISITHTGGYYVDSTHGTYRPITIADILPNDLPDEESNFLWLNENYSNVIFHDNYYALELCLIGKVIQGFSNKEVSKNTNGNYETIMITDQEESLSFEFIMNEDKFDSFIINGFTGDSAIANGTYKPAISLSSLMTNSFPLENDNANYWISEGKELYLVETDNFKYLHFNKGALFAETSAYNSLNLSVKKISDSKYQLIDRIYADGQTFEVMTLIFNFDGTFLKSIDAEFTGDYFELNGTYVAPVTITNILDTVSNFPSTSTDDAPLNAWVNKNGSKAYINKNNELILEGAPATFAVNTLLTKTGDNYTVTLGGTTLTFIMESGKLKGIERNYMSAISSFAPYEFVNDKREVTVGSTGEVSFTTNANYQNDPTKVTVKVQLEGAASPTTLTYDTDYTLQTGSTIVKLKGDYVKTLPLGTHTITIEVDGYSSVSQQFKIKSASSPTPTPSPDSTPRYAIPNTGVEGAPTNNHSLLKLSTLSLLAIGTYMVIKKKKDN